MDKPRRTGSAGVTKGMNKKKIRYIKIKEEQPKKRSSKKSRSRAAKNFGHAMTIVGTTFSAMLLILVIMVCIVATVLAVYVLDFADNSYDANLKDVEMKYTSFVYGYDEDNELVEIKRLAAEQNRVWVDYEDMPKCLIDAVVASEDKRFYTHKGVDWYRTAGAFFSNGDSGGGSTITQQLIKNITGNDETTVKRKVTEIYRALQLEKQYDKDQILNTYLNTVYFGESCYGAQTASRMYFGKDAQDLTLAECASLIGITNNPSMYDPLISDWTLANNRTRQLRVLENMYKQGLIEEKETYEAACEEKVTFTNGYTCLGELVEGYEAPAEDTEETGEKVTKANNSYFTDQVIEDVARKFVEIYELQDSKPDSDGNVISAYERAAQKPEEKKTTRDYKGQWKK
mgnify:CR=1 FL=1